MDHNQKVAVLLLYICSNIFLKEKSLDIKKNYLEKIHFNFSHSEEVGYSYKFEGDISRICVNNKL